MSTKMDSSQKKDMRQEVRRVIYCGDNLYQMSRLPDEVVDLCYIDPSLYFPNVSVASK
jgi:DNA modification methylase